MTLVEVMMAASVAAVCFAGIAAAVVQSRRLTESSIFQNSAVTVVQGYIEQMKNMEFNELPYYSGAQLRRGNVDTTDNKIYTRLDLTTLDELRISPGTPPELGSITPGAVPAGVVDNFKVIDINNTPLIATDDLRLHLWVWITALDDASAEVSSSRSIIVIYSWQFGEGTRTRHFLDTVRAIRSAVPTF